VQTLVYALYPFKFRRAIFWTLFCVVVFWLLVSLYVPPVAQAVGAGSIGKELFFSFAASQSLYWTLTLVALLGVQLWCERRFTRLEH
jgi:preprotein translocase subunit SecY